MADVNEAARAKPTVRAVDPAELEPRPLTAAEVARLAKTGCRECHGGGRVIDERIAKGSAVASEDFVWRMCGCIAKRLRGRMDVCDYGGRLCWTPMAASYSSEGA